MPASSLRLLVILGLLLIALTPEARAWWHPDWPYRKAVALDPAMLPEGAGAIEDATVLLRLHPGNFDYFFNLREDAGDLRFVGADDETVYAYHVEHYDPAVGIAFVWLRLPRLADDVGPIWMYYGNPAAPPGGQPAESFSPQRVLTLHFAELAGAPRDATSHAVAPTRFTASLVPDGRIGRGARFHADAGLALPASPVLDLAAAGGATLSFWIRLDAPEEPGATPRILGQQGAAGGFDLEVEDGLLSLRFAAGTEAAELRADRPLAWDRWQHVAIANGTALAIYLDGEQVARGAPLATFADSTLTVGARPGWRGFTGLLDELVLERGARPVPEIALAAATEQPDRTLLMLGNDEARGGGDALAEHFALLVGMVSSVRPEGWAILLLLALLGLAAADVLISKALALRRVERADARFLDTFSQARSDDIVAARRLGDEIDTRHSTLFRLYDAALEEFELGRREAGEQTTPSNAAGLIDAVRAAIEAALVRETEQLNARLVVLTLAVSGGPFLGLLGTVLGVMITFASIAAQGEVNVNTIAPGVAAALTTTVMGLIVAIPAMFGYNYLAGRIARRIAGMEVFAERCVSRFARQQAALGRER